MQKSVKKFKNAPTGLEMSKDIHFKALITLNNNMKIDNNPDAKRTVGEVPNGPDRKMRGNAAETQAAPREGSRFFRWIAPLVAAFAMNCGSIVSNSDDVDTTGDQADVPEQVDHEGEDAQDEGVADVDTDSPTETEADSDVSGSDGDADVIDVTDEVELLDSETETGDAGCTESTHIESDSVPGPVTVCDSTQTTTTDVQVTTRTGDGCESPGTIRTMVKKTIEFTPPLDTANLACARGAQIRALNGQETIVDLGPGSLDSATEIVRANMVPGGTDLDAGSRDIKFHMRHVDPVSANVSVIDADGTTIVYSLTINNTGHATATPERGGIAWNTVDSCCADVAIIVLDMATSTGTNLRTDGSIEYWTAGDGAPFAYYTTVVGTQLPKVEWDRE